MLRLAKDAPNKTSITYFTRILKPPNNRYFQPPKYVIPFKWNKVLFLNWTGESTVFTICTTCSKNRKKSKWVPLSALILCASPSKHQCFSNYMKGFAQVMDDKWVFSGKKILNFSAVQYSLNHPDYMGRRVWSGLPGSPDRTTEVKLCGIDNIQITVPKFQRKIPWSGNTLCNTA